MKNLHLVEHPILKHKLGFLRDQDTTPAEFRRIMAELGRYLAYEATRGYEMQKEKVTTPMAECQVERIKSPPIVVSIMRAGNGMLDAILTALPFARAGHIGIYRDKFINNTVEYYFKLPDDCRGSNILLVDPLIATADTVIASIDRLKQYEVGEIRCLSILASRAGLEELFRIHPDVFVYTMAIEEKMNEVGYLVPGLGDAGDRLFHTY